MQTSEIERAKSACALPYKLIRRVGKAKPGRQQSEAAEGGHHDERPSAIAGMEESSATVTAPEPNA
jgi:hypothetical protein